MCLHPDRKRSKTAAGEICIIRRYHLTQLPGGMAKLVPEAFMCRDTAKHDIAMPDDIFGRGKDRHIDAFFERGEEKRRGPGVVEQSDNTVLFRFGAEGRDILHFKCQAARRFEQNCLGPVAE